jgi:hypothetical protein
LVRQRDGEFLQMTSLEFHQQPRKLPMAKRACWGLAAESRMFDDLWGTAAAGQHTGLRGTAIPSNCL